MRTHTAVHFAKRWAELRDHPLVGEARSLGLMGALELVADKASLAPFAKEGDTGLLPRSCFREGLIMRAVRDCMIVSPPLLVSDAESTSWSASPAAVSASPSSGWADRSGWRRDRLDVETRGDTGEASD